MLVEQAIYTSCQTSRSGGYQLVAASAGIAEADVRELSLWGPSHDSLWEPGPAALSVNFHRLSSGAYCISQTTPAGAEYSGRRGPQVYTQFLVVDPVGLAEFDNNPFALLQAAIALGHVSVLEKIPKRLDPFRMDDGPQAGTVDALEQLVRHPGPVWLGLLLDRVLTARALGIAAGDRGAALVSALFRCLPRECRAEFSFTTGLRFSPRRPFRLICLPSQAAENQRLARQKQFTLFEMKGHPPEAAPLGGWASFVTASLASGNIEYLANELTSPREGLMLASVNALGDQLAQGLRRLQSSPAGAAKERGPAPDLGPASFAHSARAAPLPAENPWQRADGAHRRLPLVAAQLEQDQHEPLLLADEAVLRIDEEPARVLGEACPPALANLQKLEDAIFEVMAGKSEAIELLEQLWSKVLAQVGSARTETTREYYLRYAMAVWNQLNHAGGVHDATRGVQAMQVMSLLLGT